jgi:hypothetical protein
VSCNPGSGGFLALTARLGCFVSAMMVYATKNAYTCVGFIRKFKMHVEYVGPLGKADLFCLHITSSSYSSLSSSSHSQT